MLLFYPVLKICVYHGMSRPAVCQETTVPPCSLGTIAQICCITVLGCERRSKDYTLLRLIAIWVEAIMALWYYEHSYVVAITCCLILCLIGCPSNAHLGCDDGSLCYTETLLCDRVNYCESGSDETGDACPSGMSFRCI